MKHQAAGLIILSVTLVACTCPFFAATDPVSVAQSRIQAGDTRDEAVQALSDAWFHAECTYPNSTIVRDLFLYGPKDRERVRIVIVRSDITDGTLRVVSVGGDESYMLPQYDGCVPSPLQAIEDVTPTAMVTP
jgi:hypothetical protein